jgi:hypothetical protein
MFITQTKNKGYDMVDKGITAAVVGVPTGMAVNFFGWAVDTVFITLTGFGITILFGSIGVYYQRKRDQRDKLLYERSMTKEK